MERETTMRRLILLAFVATSFLSIHATAANFTEFLDFSEPGLPGRLYVPPEADDSARPVILYLHGAGEQGDDNRRHVGRHVDSLFEVAKDRGAFFYAPQAVATSGILNWNDPDRTAHVMETLNKILEEQNTDPNRIYVTGISMGGGGTWNIVSENPNKFAAAAPIAGVVTGDNFEAANVLGTPTWAFHARDDNLITKDHSRTVINGMLEAAGEDPLLFPADNDFVTEFEYTNTDLALTYTELATGGHLIWLDIYDRPEFENWLFAQAVPEPDSLGFFAIAAMFLFGVVRSRVQTRQS